jgi:hypothetical protein
MHPDHTPDPEPVIHVSQWPRYVDQPDGTVRAYYPDEDWYVTGVDKDDAGTKLVEESRKRMQDINYLVHRFERAKHHLDSGEVTPGYEVETISNQNYQRRTEELGDQLRGSEDR